MSNIYTRAIMFPSPKEEIENDRKAMVMIKYYEPESRYKLISEIMSILSDIYIKISNSNTTELILRKGYHQGGWIDHLWYDYIKKILIQSEDLHEKVSKEVEETVRVLDEYECKLTIMINHYAPNHSMKSMTEIRERLSRLYFIQCITEYGGNIVYIMNEDLSNNIWIDSLWFSYIKTLD